MTLLLQWLWLLIVLSLGLGLEAAGYSQVADAGREAMRTLWAALVTVIYLTFWGFCGLAAGAITRRKRHGFVLGCIGGIFLGPLALLIALLIPRR